MFSMSLLAAATPSETPSADRPAPTPTPTPSPPAMASMDEVSVAVTITSPPFFVVTVLLPSISAYTWLLTVLPEPAPAAPMPMPAAPPLRADAHGAADGPGVDRCRLGRGQGHVMAGRRSTVELLI